MAVASSTPGESFTRNRALPVFAMNSEGTRLPVDGVLLRSTPSGYVCLGMGSGAAALHIAFADGDRGLDPTESYWRDFDDLWKRDGRCARSADSLTVPPGMVADANLHRLAMLEALAKAGFDPEQTRDDHGRWTDGADGAGAAAAGVGEAVVPAAPSLAETARSAADAVRAGAAAIGRQLPEVGVEALASTAAGVGVFATVMLWPAGHAAVHEGTIADRPDIGYRYDEGALTLWQQNADGSSLKLYEGRPGADGIYRDEEGHVIGRNLDNTFGVDPAVLPALSAKAKSKLRTHLEARDRSLADTSEPEVCPDPGPDWPGSASTRAMNYQRQIADLPDGPDGRPMVVWYHGVSYDGCWPGNGNLREAKEGGYANLIDALLNGKDWPLKSKTGLLKTALQMVAQSEAAPDRIVEWHFSEQRAADFFAIFAEKMHLKNVRVIHTPAIMH